MGSTCLVRSLLSHSSALFQMKKKWNSVLTYAEIIWKRKLCHEIKPIGWIVAYVEISISCSNGIDNGGELRGRQKGYLHHLDAMEIETFRDDSKFIEEHNGFIFVVCRLKVAYLLVSEVEKLMWCFHHWWWSMKHILSSLLAAIIWGVFRCVRIWLNKPTMSLPVIAGIYILVSWYI